jgi:hypothetical protein
MRYLVISFLVVVVLISCKKSDGNSAPKIKFKSILETYASNIPITGQPLPILTIQVSDDDGDLGFNDGIDTSYIYIKNVTVTPFRIDSFKFPKELSTLPKTSFRSYVDVDIDISKSSAPLIYKPTGNNRRDSLYYEIYIKDFKKNKSNVIKTDKPLVYITP